MPISPQFYSKVSRKEKQRRNKNSAPHAFSEGKKQLIKDFWIREDISRVSPNKRHVIQRKSKNHPDAITEPIFYRQYSIKETYEIFAAEYPDVICGRSSFFKYKPSWVKKPKSKQDCCATCKEARKEIPRLQSIHPLNLDSEERVALQAFLSHKNHVKNRMQDYNNQLDNLPEGHAQVTIDFKANISLGKCAEEESHIYFNAPQRTLFGAACFFRLGEVLYKVLFTIVTPILNHDSRTVTLILRDAVFNHPVFKYFKTKRIHMWMDNAPNHFRTMEFLGFMSSVPEFEVSIDYFPEYHGKSECDRHFGLISHLYAEHYCRENSAAINTSGDFLQMYKVAINRFGGFVMPFNENSYHELRPESGTSLNVIALEFSPDGLEELALSASQSRHDSAPSVACPYVRRSMQVTPRLRGNGGKFIFTNYFHFQFEKTPGTEKILCKLDQQLGSQSHVFRFKIKEEKQQNYAVEIGVATPKKPRFGTLARTIRRMRFHEQDNEE